MADDRTPVQGGESEAADLSFLLPHVSQIYTHVMEKPGIGTRSPLDSW